MTMTKPSGPANSPRLLQLGCGLYAPQEWTNVDGSLNAWLAQRPLLKKLAAASRLISRSQLDIPWPTNIHITDARKPLPWPAEAFDAVYSSHFLEHLYRDEAQRLLRECFRVLKPGAPCRMLVPDLRTFVDEYVKDCANGKDAGQTTAGADPARRLCERLLMHEPHAPKGGLLHRLYYVLGDFHPHKWMYDEPSLVLMMSEAGFEGSRRRSFLDSEVPMLDKVEFESRIVNGEGVAVEGRKPRRP